MKKIDIFKKNIELFDCLYYTEKPSYFNSELSMDKIKRKVNIIIKNPTEENMERMIEKDLDNGEINDKVVAWKAGQLIKNGSEYEPKKLNGNYINGYGNEINKESLDLYLDNLSKDWNKLGDVEKGDFSELYKIACGCGVPKFFGTVYIINLIYFLSKKKWPIYDKFAHKALKSLFMDKNPYEIYVDSAPGKKDINNVVNMYNEFLWLLNELFGEISIERKLDRALWVYGHAGEDFDITKLIE